ncbi:MAG: 4-oxalocrotonate tautomerase [Gammaproteobacteria bacterium]|nr:MAG: 4-oxalocrotonate tautomerase [Gammaproteobacteria bacterium]
MPISITLTEGAIPADRHAHVVKGITDSFLEHHQLTGNTIMTPNVTAHLNVQPMTHTFAGGQPVCGAWIEIKVPSFALADRDIQKTFFADVTELVHQHSGQQLPKKQIWTNVLHTVDGTWNMDGIAKTNQELGQAISRG